MEYSKEKRVLMLIAITLFNLAIVSFGTYALWTSTDLLTDNNSITTGQVKMSYTETNEIGMTNALPIKDSEGKVLTNYFDFQVLSYIKTRANDDTKRKLNYNIVLEPISVDNALSDSEIKVYLTKVENGTETVVVEPTTIEKLNQYILKSQEEIFSNNKGEVLTSYRLRAWIDESVDTNKLNEKSYSYKFRVNINNEDAPIKEDYALEFAETNQGKGGLEKIIHEIDDTLQVDNRFVTEYRYRGGNSVVNNYVTFNNEIWRIIGIIPTEDTDGNVENRFKIIRDESIGDFNLSDLDLGGYNYNNWVMIGLNTYLNNDYYNTLTSDAQNMIGTTKYYLGGYYLSETTASKMWQYERKNANGPECVFTNSYIDSYDCYFVEEIGGYNPIMQSDANKKIALMHVSDYMYSFTGCYDKPLDDSYTSEELSTCVETNGWMNKGLSEWTITPSSADDDIYITPNSDGKTTSRHVYFSGSGAARPVLYLSSNVKISGGFGTSSDPYTLSVN